ncbi:hypothetical protein HWV62_11600 [Athelia sp. TMB]|nr:hypothetical protein HWV62_11600 [Athelia sp. TMB]
MANKVKPNSFFGVGSVEVESQGEKCRRLAITADKLVTQPQEGIETTSDIIDYAARTHGTKDAFGWRDIVEVHTEEKDVKKIIGGKEVTEKKQWQYFQLSDYKYISFVEIQSRVSELARGLVHYGITTENVFNMYASTSVNWQLMSHACAFVSTTIATAYDTLGESGLTHSLNEPECVGIFTNADLLSTVSRVLKNTPTVRFVVYDGEPKASVLTDIRAIRDSIQLVSIDELRETGKAQDVETIKSRRPKGDTVSCIMYTSGSTGAPKGVVLTHSNLVASVGAVYTLLGHQLKADDSFLAYLPLAHILEYAVELTLFFIGMTTGFGRVKTLTDASVRKCKGDIAAFRPSIMVGVPAVWETIRKGIVSKIGAGSAVSQSVFKGAYAAKRANVPGLSQLAEGAVLSKVKAATGGRLRLALSGGAALSRETQEFLTVALVTVLQGYGMTESCGMCAILPPDMMQYGTVGLPVPCIEIKLLDVAEAGYFANGENPQGEVCIRGPSVTKGYYKRDDLNNDETIFTKDGWLRTGDVGQWNPDGTLSLIDRIKNLVKLAGGEYIALERLESIYKACNLVANICVYASTDANKPIAIIIPHEHNLRTMLPPGVDTNAGLPALCHDDKVKELVLKECNAIGKKNGFKPMETLQAVVLTPEEWTAESGLVTAAQKIQRKKISDVFATEIKASTNGSLSDVTGSIKVGSGLYPGLVKRAWGSTLTGSFYALGRVAALTIPNLSVDIRASAYTDPLYSVATTQLAASLTCPHGAVGSKAGGVVLLVHGTGSTGDETWENGPYNKILPTYGAGYDVCWVTLPGKSLGHAATTAEYVVYNIKALASQSKTGKVFLIGHSQGAGLNIPWPLDFFPSTQPLVSGFVALSGDFRGTSLGGSVCFGLDFLEGHCSESIWQQAQNSSYLRAQYVGFSKAIVGTTSIFTTFDEIIPPEPYDSTLNGASNILIQDNDACGPAKVVDHFLGAKGPG